MQLSNSNIYFGGPDLEKNALRDILLRSIVQTPADGQISWMCYYLNDQSILNALVEAANRGVSITIFIDANPRIPAVNQHSIAYLSKPTHSAIKIIAAHKKPLWEYFGLNWHPHFHGKLYYFSHPTPHTLIGSYNPTAGIDELSDNFIREIGDHSISHNVLIDIVEPDIVSSLKRYANDMNNAWYRRFARTSLSHNQLHNLGTWDIHFLPRLRTHPINDLLTKQDNNVVIKCAVSHLKGPGIMRALTNALKSNKTIEILLDSTERRISKNYLSFLERNQIQYYQPTLPNHCLMHNKFILYESEHEHKVMFGSFNWSTRSKYLNHEIIASTSDKDIVSSFNERWKAIVSVN